MKGAIIGDVIGSVYEHHNVKSKDFTLFASGSRFTDDTVLSVAVADSLLSGEPYAKVFRAYYRQYPRAGYGGNFQRWARVPTAGAYNSWGNGSAMRVSPVAYVAQSLEEALSLAERSAEVTHNHLEGIRGAKAVAAAVYMARTGATKDAIRDYVDLTIGYDLERTLDEIRPDYKFDVSCQGSVPQAIIAFLESTDFEDAIRNAISLGGDSDTIAAITGSIAEAFYGGVPATLADKALGRLTPALRETVATFQARYMSVLS